MTQYPSLSIPRLAIIATHPIQHFVPFYRALARESDIDIKVFFGSRIGTKPYFDKEMQSRITWKMDLLSGYSHEFLSAADDEKGTSFWQPNNANLSAELTAYRPDAVLIYGYAQINALRALYWCRQHKIPALLISDSEPLSHRSKLKKVLKQILIPVIFRKCSAALSVGDNNEWYYRHYGFALDRIFRCPFTIDEPAYRKARENRADLRATLRSELNVSEETLVLLFVGKLSPRKRPNDLLDAVRLLDGAAGSKPILAVFAGNGEMHDDLRRQAAEQSTPAHFLGFVNVDRLPSIYASADILVHPSEADPHPLVCSEAACIGLPMVLSDQIGAVGPTDIAREGENAVTYPCGDVQALADTIVRLVTAPIQVEMMSLRSLKIFDELDMNRSVSGLKSALLFSLQK